MTWSYVAGEKRRNRVRVYERSDRAGIWLDYRDGNGHRVRQALETTDRERAKQKADDIAAQFRRAESTPPAAIDLRTLFDMYEREVVPRKAPITQAHNRRTFLLLLKAFGPTRKPATLNRRDWDSYIERRRAGVLAPSGRDPGPVGARIVEQDCTLLLAVLNWATKAGDGHGGYLLDRNPLAGLPKPREESPKRPVLTDDQYEAVRKAAVAMSPRVELFVVLAWYSGHRSQSIRHLRWSDVDFARGRIHWAGEHDKIGYDHWNPLHSAALEILKREQARVKAIGDAWIFPAKRTGKEGVDPWPRVTVTHLWARLAKAAELPKHERYGWHSCRRRFANRLRNAPMKELVGLGGWKSEKTVMSVYLQHDEDAQRRALAAFDSPPTVPQVAPRTGTSGE